jgi:hypothetical protein
MINQHVIDNHKSLLNLFLVRFEILAVCKFKLFSVKKPFVIVQLLRFECCPFSETIFTFHVINYAGNFIRYGIFDVTQVVFPFLSYKVTSTPLEFRKRKINCGNQHFGLNKTTFIRPIKYISNSLYQRLPWLSP